MGKRVSLFVTCMVDQLFPKVGLAMADVLERLGYVVDFPEELIDQAKHKFRPAGRSGIAPAERFSMSDIAPDLERGPDGLYFRWNGGWEPVNLFRNGALSPQRDPDGNVWTETDGEWSLMDEVG